MLIQIHILQNYAPSNLNRDDAGSPKDAMFGGYRRGRISSQCLKRNIRNSEIFKNEFEKDGLLGFRTQRMPFEVSKELVMLGASNEEVQNILTRLINLGKRSKEEKDNNDENEEETSDESSKINDKQIGSEADVKVPETKQLIFLCQSEISPFAKKILEVYRKMGAKKWLEKKTKNEDIENQLGESIPRSVDIAMFGRMTTSKAFKDIQASVQVAHALSTNALTQEFDYYTAMDDLKPGSEPGADMIGDVEFNSSTYYKYFNIHWNGLFENLCKDTEVSRRAMLALLEAAIISQPTGKQNSFAAQSLPDFILVEVSKKNIPVSYVNAFLKPIYPRAKKSMMDVSEEALNEYTEKMSKMFGFNMERAFMSSSDFRFFDGTYKDTLADLKIWLAEKIVQYG